MITHHWHRTKDDTVYIDGPAPQDFPKALDILINAELRFGAKVIVLEPNRVQVKTVVFGSEDVTTWSGECPEVEILYRIAAFYEWAKSVVLGTPEINQAMMDRLMEFSKGLPLLLVHGSGMVLGRKWAHIALLAMLTHEKDLNIPVTVCFSDVYTAFCMIYAEGYSVADVKALLGEELFDESQGVATPA